ncbi:unnamed protein product [Cyprideis torosa]|uniref:Uncharacterized protein n=1 Tax=Cyprideis torosa TaxID=163714 RepID=A0A7R8ZNQ2_9CRUS|nr:unnamed protein product [Cyprideis torosa]CAG0886855.1 unnamed protein product [Cyprideis torosa]
MGKKKGMEQGQGHEFLVRVDDSVYMEMRRSSSSNASGLRSASDRRFPSLSTGKPSVSRETPSGKAGGAGLSSDGWGSATRPSFLSTTGSRIFSTAAELRETARMANTATAFNGAMTEIGNHCSVHRLLGNAEKLYFWLPVSDEKIQFTGQPSEKQNIQQRNKECEILRELPSSNRGQESTYGGKLPEILLPSDSRKFLRHIRSSLGTECH